MALFRRALGIPATTLFALAKAAILDPLQGRFDLFENALLVPEQIQGEFLVEGFGANLRHIGGHADCVDAVLVEVQRRPSGSYRPRA